MITSIDQLSDDQVIKVVDRMNGPEKGRNDSFGIDPGLSPVEAIVAVTLNGCYIDNVPAFMEKLRTRYEQITQGKK